MKPEILFEDKDIIVCVKKAGEPVQSDKTLDYDLVNRLKNYLCEEQGAKNPYIGLVHRLDRPVGGAMVFAKTSKAASRMSDLVRRQAIERKYLAVVRGLPTKNEAKLEHYLYKNTRENKYCFAGGSICDLFGIVPICWLFINSNRCSDKWLFEKLSVATCMS